MDAEEKFFLAEIRRLPDDDGPRLIYADWLEERRGRSIQAEFIRLSCMAASRGFPFPQSTVESCSDNEVKRWLGRLASIVYNNEYELADAAVWHAFARDSELTRYSFNRGLLYQVTKFNRAHQLHIPQICEHSGPIEIVIDWFYDNDLSRLQDMLKVDKLHVAPKRIILQKYTEYGNEGSARYEKIGNVFDSKTEVVREIIKSVMPSSGYLFGAGGASGVLTAPANMFNRSGVSE